MLRLKLTQLPGRVPRQRINIRHRQVHSTPVMVDPVGVNDSKVYLEANASSSSFPSADTGSNSSTESHSPLNEDNGTASSSPLPTPTSDTTTLPVPVHANSHSSPSDNAYSKPPFNTHHFFQVLEKTFPTQTARGLMRATRALLVDRMGRVRREAVGVKDLENHAYLFRAALSELRTEVTSRARGEAASIKSATISLRRDVDKLDIKMKEDISTLKHEVQMEVNNRKNESKEEMRAQTIVIEEMVREKLIEIGNLRSEMESIRWDNMRRSVLTLGIFLGTILLAMEIIREHEKSKSKSLAHLHSTEGSADWDRKAEGMPVPFSMPRGAQNGSEKPHWDT